MNTPQDPIQFLQERGFIHQSTELEGLREHLQQGCATIYLGFDATADSLHVGHLQGLMVMRWLQRFGHRPILLIGGATTRIGDPGFRDESRPMLSEAQIQHNIAGICQTLARLVQLGQADNAGLMEDNADWLDGMGYLQFLNQVGRHFSINRLPTFDAVCQRLDREHSLSFQEFGYTLLQTHDFTELASRQLDVTVTCCVRAWAPPSMAWISWVAWRVLCASFFTSSATTEKPRPTSPARAASMAAFNASRLV
jgi:tyrosyl-tRNA synthetase